MTHLSTSIKNFPMYKKVNIGQNFSENEYIVQFMETLYGNITNSHMKDIVSNSINTSPTSLDGKSIVTIRTFRVADKSHIYYNISSIEDDEEIIDAHLRISCSASLFKNRSVSNRTTLQENQSYDKCFHTRFEIISYSTEWIAVSIKDYIKGAKQRIEKIIRYEFISCILYLLTKDFPIMSDLQFLIIYSSETKYGLELPKLEQGIINSVKRSKRDLDVYNHGSLVDPSIHPFRYSPEKLDYHDPGNNYVPQEYTIDMCQKYDMEVDFKTLGFYQEWIIAPTSFNAYFCDGSCSHNMVGLDQNPTNHATLQGLLHAASANENTFPTNTSLNDILASGPKGIGNQSEVPPLPCCVPNKLEPLTVLYYDEWKNVVLKRYPDMVASSCGCH